ncbi:MAG TPA: glycosyltransferase family 4 protein [Sedimentisphaerales bacterium]|nr:glycosyltransferase family 4 protein [Sedimentisphaerales bacterium]
MRVLIVHNEYGKFSGEEAVVRGVAELLRRKGHTVIEFSRSSAELETMRLGQVCAFFNGIYSPSSRKAMGRLLAEHQPDLVHVHNVFPLISPSILPECRRAGVPVVMTVHNYRLVCPNGLHMPKGRYEICEKCCGGKEYWCVLKNCEQSYAKSLGYALRNYVARRLGFFRKNVTLFACLTEFQRRRLIAEGYPADCLRVIPNMCPVRTEVEDDSAGGGDYAAYVGRISPEKGIEVLLSVAERLPDVPFRLAGSYDAMPELVGKASANVSFLGNLDAKRLAEFYRQSRVLVLSSRWFEGFPMAIVEAMAYGKAVVAPRIGGIPEIVDDGVTGLLFVPGNAEDLAEKVRYLWASPNLCRRMGRSGREKALREYSPESYYGRLAALYQEAIALGSGCAGPPFERSSIA